MNLQKYSGYGLALLRIVAAYMFLWHGTSKFWGYPVSMGEIELFSLMGIGGVLEIGGGILILLGIFTRPAAFLLSGQMAYAYFFMHASLDNIFLPLVNEGELALLYSVVFFYIFLQGAGKLALGNLFCKCKDV